MSIQIGSVTINQNPVYPLDWYPERYNQASLDMADAALKTYDGGPTVIHGKIILKGVLKSEGDALRDYLTDTAIFQKSTFTITPKAGGNTDLGAGTATALQNCNYEGGNDLSGVFTLVPPGRYDIEFPYRAPEPSPPA